MKARILSAILGILIVGIATAQNEMGRFNNYNLKEGISQSSIMDIFQDKKGFMWFGTIDGLNKFDGKKFKIYKNNYKDINSISDNWIYKILLEDSDHNLWILTGDQAINKLNLKSQQFHRYIPIENKLNTIPEFQHLYGIEEDTIGNVWISTNVGLFKFYSKSDRIKKYKPLATKDSTKVLRFFYKTFKDSRGNLWVTSPEGICRYDYKQDTFLILPEFKNIPPPVFSGNIMHVFETDSKQLWILTSKGLKLYNPDKKTFISFDFPVKYDFQFEKLEWHKVLHDKHGNLWIPTVKGLLKFNINKAQYKLYVHSDNPGSISNNRITKIIPDNSGQIWIGTMKGLNLYNALTDNFTRFFHKNFPKNNIDNIIALQNGEIWTLGQKQTMGGSPISKLNKKSNYLENITTNNCDPNSIASSVVYAPFIDRDANLWLATFNNGIIKYTTQTNKFKHYIHIPNDHKSLKTNNIWGFTEDKTGNIWITQSDKLIAKFDTISHTFTNYPIELKKKELQYILMNVVYCGNGDLLIATLGAGLLRFNPSTGNIKAYLHDPKNQKSISGNMLHMITKDNTGKIWIANAFHGVDIFDPVSGTFEKMQHDPQNSNSLSNNNLWTIAADKENNIWISAEGYIDCYNTVSKKFKHYKAKDNIEYGLLNDKAISILCDTKGDMWFGTSGGGMSKFDKNTGKFTHYTEFDGLANNVVYGIIEDNLNNLWLSTNRGISKFNKETRVFTNYYENSGVQGEFNQNAYFKSSTNLIYFGGTNGINVFNASDITQDTIAPQTILTGFHVSGKQLPVIDPERKSLIGKKSHHSLIYDGTNYYLPIDAPYLKELVIPYHAKVFTLEFTSNSYNFPDKVAFRYKMENFDKDWNYATNNNFATYTNLPAGEYIFRVTAANSDGYWNPKSYDLKITIVPPFWKSWWFIALIISLVICLIWFYIILRERNLKHSKAALENKIKERTQQIEEKNEELKLRNIEISKQKEEISFQAKQLKSELILQNKVSEMALLRSQINPHFLFNTLNNVYSLVYQKSEEAPASIMKLSEIMRYMLYDAVDGKVAFEKEINYLKSFIELQLLRIKNKNFIEFNISGNIYGKTIAPMIFIPFIENAFKHGSKKDGNPGIIINLILQENSLHFDISNQCQNKETSPKDKTGGIGLTNVRRRLELIYPNEHILEISKTDDQFKVLLELTLS